MSDPIQELEGWLEPILQSMRPAERAKMARTVRSNLLRSQRARIKAQKNPDGSPFKARAVKQPINKPISFVYRKEGSNRTRVASMVSFRDEGDRMVGFDIEAGGLRTFLKSRVVRYIPPIHKSGLRAQSGSIKRQAMFSKIRQSKFMVGRSDSSSVSVEFVAGVSKIARNHQFGRTTRIDKDGTTATYPRRELLGFTREDIEMIQDTVLNHISQK